ncbi:hypothetical protein SAY86_028292 [Trapa natans]|uniref:DUF4005 domain-containing protein n=1 Tax=Trapa natans TaxID=22666 RepID=A0AAN7MHM9_TRANT|nr:hypothetical protein SAY86_028292 [Trapa natans]
MGKSGGGSSASSSWLSALKRAFIYSPTKKSQKRITSGGRDHLEHSGGRGDKGQGKRKWAIQRDDTSRELSACQAKTTRATAEAVGKAGSDPIEMAIATTVAAEAAVATARAALEALPLAHKRPFPCMLELRHKPAIIIQTVFRGYLARKALKALRGLVCLQAFIRGHNVRRRAEMTLRCIQALVRMQAHLTDQRRTRLSLEVNSTGHVKRSIKEYLNVQPQDDQKEIKAILLEKNEEYPRAQELSLASSAFSQQIWNRDEDSDEQCMKRKLRDSPRRTSFDQRDYIKTIEIDTYGPSYSGKASSIQLPKRVPIQANTSSPRCPSYMCSTESARARLRSHSNPRQRASTPEKEMMMIPSSRKPPSFPDPEQFSHVKCPSNQEDPRSARAIRWFLDAHLGTRCPLLRFD